MAHTSDTGLISRAREFMDRFAASRAERNSHRQSFASGTPEEPGDPQRPLGSFNPMVVAVSLYTTPRRNS